MANNTANGKIVPAILCRSKLPSPINTLFEKIMKRRNTITRSFIGGVLLSLFLYLEAADLDWRIIQTIFAPLALFCWLRAGKKEAFWLGFFAALMWFWWVGLSFRFTEYLLLAPVAALFVAFVFGLIFWLISFAPLWARAFLIAFGFWFVEPFSFAWFKPELMITNSYFSLHKFAFPALVFALMLLIYLRRNLHKWQYLTAPITLCILMSFLLPTPPTPAMPNVEIMLQNTWIDQTVKWDKNNIAEQINEAFDFIDHAIDAQQKIVVLPEAAFALFLNMSDQLLDELTLRSFNIAIVAGGLNLIGVNPYNSAYIFNNGAYLIANKVFLVPFGEASPLPKWAGRVINNLFFDGATDYLTADAPTDFSLYDQRFRIAICYEAAIERMYIDSPSYIIAISNNGWFVPSIEPYMQRLFMKLYARRYGVIVFHASNMSNSEIIY